MNTKLLRIVIDSLEALKDETGREDLRLPLVLTLLHVADRKEVSHQELSKLTRVSQSATAKNLMTLGEGTPAKGLEGFGLVDSFEDPLERRRKLARLTTKGKEVMKAIETKAGRFINA
ncbi:hypothetical protein A7981_05770 [Methylovorus sp. MM2]|uniref:hypothetical protein n=1 Tax=Methylovorus sp. MM2 TaxID=1848038 RepID=UPI0007E0F306|nr:hypothetical protein [Methylovorus sp. MM2]OAM52941.1 hypothetical protein A7981_05770 [Methylovorus sp. MM2]